MMKSKILELIDFEKVNTILEGFNKTTGFVTAILDLDGDVLSKSGWRQICTEFHRINPETSKKCTVSDTVLAGKMAEGEKYHFYKCFNGLVDVAVPIYIKGEHIANLFSGQFFFELPDRSFFINQAKKYGFDEAIYLEALDKVPIVSKEKVIHAMNFLLDMTYLISDITYQKMELIEQNNEISKSEQRWQFAIEGNGDGIWEWNAKTNYVFFSKQWKSMLGYEENEIENTLDEWENRVHPEDKENVFKDLNRHFNQETPFYINEHRVLCKDGTYKWILDRGKVLQWDKQGQPLWVIGTHTDISERKLAEEQNHKQLAELKRYNATMVDREIKMIQLKQEINDYCRQLNLPEKYLIPTKK